MGGLEEDHNFKANLGAIWEIFSQKGLGIYFRVKHPWGQSPVPGKKGFYALVIQNIKLHRGL